MRIEDIRKLGERALEFEKLLTELFSREGFTVTPQPSTKLATLYMRPDLLIESASGNTAIIEAKLFSSRTFPTSTMTAALGQLETFRRQFQTNKGILAAGAQISAAVKDAFKSIYPAILIYDLDVLVFLFAKHADLQRRFEELVRETLRFSDTPEANPVEVNVEKDLAESANISSVPPPALEEQKGRKLCSDIKAIPPGRAHAKAFEKKMVEVLEYLFEKDLTAWSPQKATDAGISVNDLIARVNSTHDFWKALVNHFYSRYVVFELKNYGGKIKQGQIYTTEKYLYRTALRSTAIIISRKGADKNALAVCRGALREQGKLIINLTTEDICMMLQLRDEPGGDYNSVLMEYVDDMLMKLER